MLILLAACLFETNLSADRTNAETPIDRDTNDTAWPTDSGKVDEPTDDETDAAVDETDAAVDETDDTSPPDDSEEPDDTAPPDDTGRPPDDVVDTGTAPTPEPPSVTDDPCADAPTIDCPTSVLDPTPCTDSVAAWLPSGATYTDVQAALDDAASGDTVAICPGTWLGTFVVKTDDLTIRGYGDTSVLDGNGTEATLTVVPDTVTVADLTITGGASAGFGGGISASDADVKLCTVDVTGNTAPSGGGLYVGTGSIEVYNSRFSENEALSDSGGAIYSSYADITVLDSDLERNASLYGGGAIVTGDGLVIAVYGSTFTQNTTGYEGGGVAMYAGWYGSNACFVESAFTENNADYAGGAVSSNGFGIMTTGYESCMFEGNTAVYVGGAIAYQQWVRDVSSTVDSTFTANSAGQGGAISLAGGWGELYAAFYRTKFDSNTASLAGAIQAGGVGTETVLLYDGSVTSNTATWAGGIYIDTTTTIEATNVDFGSGSTDNEIDDVYGYTGWGAGATFSCSGGICL
jgi:predicted outer membrane repeat protein